MKKKTIHLRADRLENEHDMSVYMHELFRLPAHMGKDLDSLEKCLSAYPEDILILMDSACVHELCQNKYAFNVLMMLGRCVEANEHLQIQFDKSEEGHE